MKIYVLEYHEDYGARITRIFTTKQAAYLALKKEFEKNNCCAGRVTEYENKKNGEFIESRIVYKQVNFKLVEINK